MDQLKHILRESIYTWLMNNMRKPPLSPTHNFLGIQRTCFKGILKGKKWGLPEIMPNVVKTCSLQPLRRSASESEVAEVY